MMARMDTSTKWQGIYARHQSGCAVEASGACDCKPRYIAKAWDRHRGRKVASPTFARAAEARAWRRDTLAKIDAGTYQHAPTGVRFDAAAERFLAAAEAGEALNNRGRRYKPNAVRDYRGSLDVHVLPALGRKHLAGVQRRDMQAIVDAMVARGSSGSRVRSVVTAVRALYRWARQRDLAHHDPCAGLHLPAVDETARDAIPDPARLARLLDALPAQDALPFALAGYGTGRRSEIQALRWRDIDLKARTIRWGEDETARKSSGARRTVPIPAPLLARLRAAQLAQGRPDGAALVVPPLYAGSKTGRFSAEALLARARKHWADNGLDPIGLHDARHASASYLIAAGVNLKAVSVVMGHASIQITIDRYGHLLPGAEAEVGALLDAFLTARGAVGL